MTDEYLMAVAFGMYALTVPLAGFDYVSAWAAMTDDQRAPYVARARFVLSWADPSALDAGRSLSD